MNAQKVTLFPENYHLTRVLVQEKHGAPFKVIKNLSVFPKSSLLWIFETGFIENLPWDPGEWHCQGSPPLGDAPFFGYSAKRGYRKAKRATKVPIIHSFIQQLNLNNSTDSQVLARIWHSSRPYKVGTLIWLTLNPKYFSKKSRFYITT
jgi:hypothetical protein